MRSWEWDMPKFEPRKWTHQILTRVHRNGPGEARFIFYLLPLYSKFFHCKEKFIKQVQGLDSH